MTGFCLCYLSVFVMIKKWLYLIIINLIIIVHNNKKNCICLWNCTFTLLHLALSWVDNDRLCHVISPCPLHPIAISFVCYLLNLHHSSWISWNYFLKVQKINIIFAWYIRERDTNKMFVWVFVCYERCCTDSLSSADCAVCILHDFAWLTSVFSLFLSSFLSIAEGKELLSLALNIIIQSVLPCPPA